MPEKRQHTSRFIDAISALVVLDCCCFFLLNFISWRCIFFFYLCSVCFVEWTVFYTHNFTMGAWSLQTDTVQWVVSDLVHFTFGPIALAYSFHSCAYFFFCLFVHSPVVFFYNFFHAVHIANEVLWDFHWSAQRLRGE